MSETLAPTNPTASPDAAADAPHASTGSAPRRRMGSFVATAVVFSALGAAAAVGWIQYTDRQATESTSVATTGAAPAESKPDAMAGMDMSGEGTAAPDGAVYISPARQQLIGVRTADVGMQTLDATIRTVGTLAYDETRVTEIHPKVSGWVEQVFVDFVGKPVRRGQPLLTLYSPDLVATQNEYLLALKGQRTLSESTFPETRTGAESLVAATRDRLRLWDISDAQIAELERTQQARRTMTLYSPFDGIVLERNTFAGQYIAPEMSTVKIADLSNIWAIAQIFEFEARRVKLGDRAEIEFPYGQSTRRLTGRVAFVYPEINAETRRARVRIEFRNPGLELKPESYVTVILRRTAETRLAIPKEALLDSGAKRYAIVARPNGYFEPREIEVGEPSDEFYPVIKGLATGDSVVTSAQFLIDSETNLQAALGAMANMPGMNVSGGTADKTNGPASTPTPPPAHQHPQ